MRSSHPAPDGSCLVFDQVSEMQVTLATLMMGTLFLQGLFYLKLHFPPSLTPALSLFPTVTLTPVFIFLNGTVSPMTIWNYTGRVGGTLGWRGCSFERHLLVKQTKSPTGQKSALVNWY